MKGLILLFLASLTACNLAPRYKRPAIDMPTSWRTDAEMDNQEGSTLTNVRWWENLDDPVLNTLITTALENNKDLQTAAWTVCEYYGQYQIVRSSLFPQVDLGASALKERFPVDASFLPVGFDPVTAAYSFDFNLAYQIDLWGQLRNASRASFSEFLAQIENRRNVVLTLISSVAQSYIFLRQLDLELDISLKTFETRRESLQIARDRFEGGLTSQIEVAQAGAAFEEALGEVKILERRIPQQENLLSILLGQNPGPILRGKAVNDLTLPAVLPTGQPSDLLTRRPDILQAENVLVAANANIGVARAAFFPEISFNALWGGADFKLHKIFSKNARAWQIGGDLLQQIFTGGRLVGQLNVSKAQQKEALFQYEQTILNAFREVNDALIAHKIAKELIHVYTAKVIDLKQYLKLAWLRYYEGQTQYLTVLDAERDLFAAQLQLAGTQGSLFLTLADIYKAVGGGWVADADASLRECKTDCPENTPDPLSQLNN